MHMNPYFSDFTIHVLLKITYFVKVSTSILYPHELSLGYNSIGKVQYYMFVKFVIDNFSMKFLIGSYDP